MVDRDVQDLLLMQMRETGGFKELLVRIREEYLKAVRRTVHSCNTEDELRRLRAGIDMIGTVLSMTGMSKEDVNRWMEIR